MATTLLDAGGDQVQDVVTFPSGTSGTVSWDSTVRNTGTGSYLLNTSSPAVNAILREKLGTVSDTSRFSARLRISGLPAAENIAFIAVNNSAEQGVFNIALNTNGKLSIRCNGVDVATGTFVFAANTQTRVSCGYTITNTTTFTITVYINGTQDVTISNNTLARTGSDHIQFFATSGSGTNYKIWVDDIYCDNGSGNTDPGASAAWQPGALCVTNKRPFSNGTNVQYVTGIGADPGSPYGSGHAVRVNEQPLSQTNGWSVTNAAKQTEEYTIEGLTVGDCDLTYTTLVDFMGWVQEKVGSASTGNIIVAGSATNISVTTAYTLFLKAAGSTTYPAGNTDIGVDTNTVNQLFSLSECGVLFAFNRQPVFSRRTLGPRVASRSSQHWN
jgi:hypothetical protein